MSTRAKINFRETKLYKRTIFLLVLLFILFFGLLSLVQTRWAYDTFLFPQLSKTLGGTLTVGAMRVKITRDIELHDVRFLDKLGNQNTISFMRLRYRPFTLILGRAVLEEITVQDAYITLDAFVGEVAEEIQPEEKRNSDDPNELYPKLLTRILVEKARLKNIDLVISGSELSEELPGLLRVNDISIAVDNFEPGSGGKLSFDFEMETDGEQTLIPQHARGHFQSTATLPIDRKSATLQFDFQLNELLGKAGPLSFQSEALRFGGELFFTHEQINLRGATFSSRLEEDETIRAKLEANVPLIDRPISAHLFFEQVDNEALVLLDQELDFLKDGELSGEIQTTYSRSGAITSEGKVRLGKVALNTAPDQILQLDTNYKIEQKGNTATLHNLDSKLYKNGGEILDIAFKGNASNLDTTPDIKMEALSNKIDVKEIVTVLLKNESTTPSKRNSEPSLLGPIILPELPALPLSAQFKAHLSKITYNETIIKEFKLDSTFNESGLTVKNLSLLQSGAPFSASLTYPRPLTHNRFKGEMFGEGVKIGPLANSFLSGTDGAITGKIPKFQLKLSSFQPEQEKQQTVHALKVDMRTKLADVEVPAHLQDTPPINILFLPITALDETVGALGGALLPSGITEATNSLKGEMKEGGQLQFDSAQVRLHVNEEGFVVKDTLFNGNIIPTITLDGTVGYNEKLDMTVGVELLKVPVPLTVGGSLSLPLPDIPAFVPSVVSSLGLGLVNIGGVFVSADEEEFFQDGMEVASREVDPDRSPPTIINIQRDRLQ